jgi:two-component system response regulator AtoC
MTDVATAKGQERARESGEPDAPHKADLGVAPAILLVDDEDLVRWSLRQRLSADGCVISEAATGAAARAELVHPFDLVLLDYRLPDADGLTLLREIRRAHPDTLVILLTAHTSVQRAVEAMAEGAFYFVSKPFDVDHVAILVHRALETTQLQRQVRALLARDTDTPLGSPLLGESPQMLEVKRLIRRFAQSRASTVLITGETGVGKDVAARALHAVSDRADKPFTNITCSALPDSLLESELFGYERGAFTDARQRKIGLLEQADGGTVFLDEIGEMALGLQAKLLRFLEEKAFRRVGGSDDIRPDVRVVAATNRDLLDAVRDGRFREDLYYRIAVLQIPIPPLRERGDDIGLLSTYFVDRFNRAFHKRVGGLSRAAMAQLSGYDWPGNVRELRNVIERAMLLTENDMLETADLRLIGAPQDASAVLHETGMVLPEGGIDLDALVRNLVAQALQRTNGNKTRAAALLRMTRDQIRYRVEKYHFEASSVNGAPATGTIKA